MGEALPEQLAELLLEPLEPIHAAHTHLLQEAEQRLAAWEGGRAPPANGEQRRIGDLLLSSMPILPLYKRYLERHEEILSEIEINLLRNKGFEAALHEFEAQKVCYLPFNTFLLKPAQRLIHYKLILERESFLYPNPPCPNPHLTGEPLSSAGLLSHYGPAHADFRDCQGE